MRRFAYERPASVAEAVAALRDQEGAMYLGGGTNLVDLMKLGVETPGVLVDVTRLGLDEVVLDPDGWLRIGAGVANSDLAVHRLVRERYPVLSEALLAGASGQLRNRATVGGNLLQRTRCRYFQDVSKPCNKRSPGSGCPAVAGEHHNMAIFGSSPACVATHPSDMAVALAALEATVQVEGHDGPRELPVTALYRLPGGRPDLEHTLEPGELVTAVRLAPLEGASVSTYRKVRERSAFAFALVSVAGVLELAGDGTVGDVRLALGGVAYGPWRARRFEAMLRGRKPERATVRDAIDAELATACPLPKNSYKVALVRHLVVAVVSELVAR